AEVDEVAAEAALHHPVRGDGRVDPAREEHEAAPARADGKPAAAGELLRVREDLALVDLEVDLEVRPSEVDAEPELVLDGAPDERGELVRDELERLVAPARAHRERVAGAPSEKVDRALRRGLRRPLDEHRRVA